ncbi:MAG: hypothetical protein Kow00109_12990 [Acidobacteriota bacterium]
MRRFLQLLSTLGLILTVVPSFYVLYGVIPWETHADLMLAGMLLWFASAPFWMKGESLG